MNLRHQVITLLWVAWLIFWIFSARQGKATERRETALSRLLHFGPIALGMFVLSSNPGTLSPGLSVRWIREPEWLYWFSAALVAVGLVFACWARVSLGSNWSAAVTLKRDHQLIVSGPYRYVRHPIYTGLLFALFGTALETTAWRGVIGFALIATAIAYKYRTEERFLTDKFGDEYVRYKGDVPALVPFWR
jgi:protein-S-isoprenylcysteine O-methyltransferase Ste14